MPAVVGAAHDIILLKLSKVIKDVLYPLSDAITAEYTMSDYWHEVDVCINYSMI